LYLRGWICPNIAANGEAAWRSGGFTTVHAGHGTFKFVLPLLRASAAVAPNRMLAAAILQNFFIFVILLTKLSSTFLTTNPFSF